MTRIPYLTRATKVHRLPDAAPALPPSGRGLAARLALLIVLGHTATGASAAPVVAPTPTPTASATPATPTPLAPREVMHDHTPRHGGTVGMADTYHLEVVARADGTIFLYLTDLFRTPVPLDDRLAFARLASPDVIAIGTAGRRAMVREGDAFVLRGEDLAGRTQIDVRFELERRAVGQPTASPGVALEPLLVDFTIPVEPTSAKRPSDATGDDPLRSRGAAGPIANDCRTAAAAAVASASAPDAISGIVRLARLCALRFRGPVDAIALDPTGNELAIAALDSWVTTWGLPPSTLRSGFAPSPPLAVPAEEASQPHGEAVGALAWRPGGTELLVTSENRLLIHRARDGALLRELPRRSAIIRDAEFLPDGNSLVVATFFDRAVQELASEDGREIRRIATGAEVASLAVSPDGTRGAAGLENGRLVLFRLASTDATAAPREIDISAGHAVTALLWLRTGNGATRLAVGSMDGVLRLVDPGSEPGSARIVAASSPGRPIVALAGPLARPSADSNPAGAWLASGGYDGSIRIHDPTTAVRETLPIQGGTVRALATARDWLVVGDASGVVSFWRLHPGAAP